MKITDNIRHLTEQCISDEAKKVLIIYDQSTAGLIEMFRAELEKAGKTVMTSCIAQACCHGQEPDSETAGHMLAVDVILCLTRYSLAHTAARRVAEERGIAFLSMPEYSRELLESDAIAADYRSIVPMVVRYAGLLTSAGVIHVTTPRGTDLIMHAGGRKGNACPGLTNKAYLLGSPPDIEANVAPLEDKTEGVLVIDGSVTDPRLGLLHKPLYLKIEKGSIAGIRSEDTETEAIVKELFEAVHDAHAYIVGEFGIGFNDKAVLCGNMLTDEGTKGCVHFGMGSNWTIGGQNKVGFHLDFVMKQATVKLDDVAVIEDGVLLYE